MISLLQVLLGFSFIPKMVPASSDFTYKVVDLSEKILMHCSDSDSLLLYVMLSPEYAVSYCRLEANYVCK